MAESSFKEEYPQGQ
ncbi:hypothetical protein Prudu_013162 [Prunus dulcis]|uniref:Uncharacterized protein n=1 Tax=Prunus dulcis TaxID=3755 RepID=A0A4Y1REI7_PRUDU|nr:hypothetical protein Prudu_013162 [Prunus dulcis]